MIHGFDVCIGTLLWFQSRPDSKIRSPLWLRWVRRSDLGWPLLPPSFLSSSPANHRAGGDGPSRRQAQGVVRPAAQRGHGPARLDGPAAPATVAGSAMKEGKTGDRTTAKRHGRRTHAARRAPPRAAGTPDWRSPERAARHRHPAQADQACSAGFRGAKPARRGGPQADPWRQAQRAAPKARRHRHRRAEKPGAPHPRSRDDAPSASVDDQPVAGATIVCNCSITPGSTNTQA